MATTQTPKFKIGAKLVYPGYGVAQLVRVETHTVAGRDQKFYVLRLLGNDATIMIPNQKANQVGLRPVMGTREARAVLGVLRKPPTTPSGPWNRRHREYQERLKTGQPEAVASVLRDLLRLQGNKELSFSERKTLETARGLLVTELALAKDKPVDKIEQEIDRICGPA